MHSLTISKSSVLSTCRLFTSVRVSVNGAQFLNNVCILFLSAAPTTFIDQTTSIYASL